MHTPLVMGDNGEKLSKQNGALALDLRDTLSVLNRAAEVLSLEACGGSVGEALTRWVEFLQNP
jgi:glutamyl-Q tRNA(Asp) synthetase